MMNKDQSTQTIIKEYIEQLKTTLDNLSLEIINRIVKIIFNGYLKGNTIFIIGNGGSAACASHMACDLGHNLIKKLTSEKPPAGWFKVISLSDNNSVITALANDIGYEWIFSEQLKMLASSGDILLVISGSGNSPNVIEAAKLANIMGLTTIGLLGFDGGKIREFCDISLVAHSSDYGPVEDIHMILSHIFTECLRQIIAKKDKE